MSLVNYSVVQGIIAGGTACYLPNRVKQEAVQKKPDTWVTAALQVNHLLLLTSETVLFAGVPLGAFGLLVQSVYVLTPLSLVAVSLCGREITPLSPERVDQLNTVYRVGVVATAVVTLALGNPAFAAASLLMLAIDAFAKGDGDLVFTQIKKVTAFCALVGYGAQVFLSEGFMSSMAMISTTVVGGKLCLLDLIPEGVSSASKVKDPVSVTDKSVFVNHSMTPRTIQRESYYPYYKEPRRYWSDMTSKTPPAPIQRDIFAKPSTDKQSGNVFCRFSALS